MQADKPEARLEFARRLRELRVPKGYRTARSLARALDIDENRYTRYERAEVEPDLAMIRKICVILKVSPSDLLGPNDAVAVTEKREPAAEARGRIRADGSEARNGSVRGGQERLPLATSIWALAEAVTALRQGREAAAGQNASPLAEIGQTSTLFQSLVASPFETITEVLRDPAVASATPDLAAGLRLRIEQVVHRLKEASGG